MDSAIGDVQLWANSQLADSLASAWSESVTFLGYAFLSELAQRPEYRVISETIASEMTRKWITFYSVGDEDSDENKTQRIRELQAEFERLDVRGALRRSTEQDGYFGRGHIYINTGDNDDPDELLTSIGCGNDTTSKSKIGKKHPVKSLKTIEAVWCYPTDYNSNNPLENDWYCPTTWFVQSRRVHATRLITVIGREVPDLLKPTYSFGGLSLSQMVKPYVDNWLETRQSVNDIIQSFVTWVLKTKMATSTMPDGSNLFDRLDLFNELRNNRGIMAIDKNTEEFANVAAPLSGLSELQAQAQEHMASASHIPLVKLTGISPQGLNASSEGELQTFYDWIASFQEKLYRPIIQQIMWLVMLSLWDELDDEISFKFDPLWAMDEQEAASIEQAKAQTDATYIDAGVLAPEEVRNRLASDENSGYNSIDVDDAPDLGEEEEEGLEPGTPDPAMTGSDEPPKSGDVAMDDAETE